MSGIPEEHIPSEVESENDFEEDSQEDNSIEGLLKRSKGYQGIQQSIQEWRDLNARLAVEQPHSNPTANRIIQYLAEGKKGKEICELEGISQRTLTRLKKEYGISTYSADVPDDLIIKAMVDILQTQSTHLGWVMMQGYLKGTHANDNIIIKGLYKIKAGQRRILKLLKKAKDSIGVEPNLQREMKKPLRKRVYINNGAMDVLHIDFHDKLKHWGMYIHGAIDGHTRFCVWLFLTTTHKSYVVYEIYRNAVMTHGLPNSLRSDKGKECVLTAFAQLAHGGQHMTGRSVHNTPIEGFWNHVIKNVVCKYKELFLDMEQQGLLNTEDELQMAMLHLVFLPAIGDSLGKFQVGWNHHTMRGRNRGVPAQRFADDSEQAERVAPHVFELPTVKDIMEQYGNTGKEKMKKFPEVVTYDPLEGCLLEEGQRKR
jgi:hypothetical protein